MNILFLCREKILSRTENLKEAHVEVQLFNLTSAETEFKMDFWSQIVSNVDDDLGGQSADAEPMRLEVSNFPAHFRIHFKKY